MKNKKKIFIFSIVGLVILIIAYFVYTYLIDDNENKISRKVKIVSYEEYFNQSIEKKFNSKFDKLNDLEKIKLVKELINSNDDVLQIVGLRYLSKNFGNQSIEVAQEYLKSKKPEVVEEAIYTFKKFPKEVSEKVLKDFIINKLKSEDLNIPFSDILRLNIFGRKIKGGINLEMNEIIQKQSDISKNEVYEINLFIPKGYDFIFSFPNFDDNWKEFEDSKMISLFKNTEAYNDLKKLSAFSEYFKVEKLINDKIGFLSKYFYPRKLLRDDLKIAKYKDDLLFVTFKGKNLEVLTKLMDNFKSSNSSYSVEELNYQSQKIFLIKDRNKNIVLSFCAVTEYFLFSTNPGLIEKSIDCFQKDNSQSATFDMCFRDEYEKLDMTGKNDFVFAFLNPYEVSGFKGDNNYSAYLIKVALNVLKELGSNLDFYNFNRKEEENNFLRFLPSDVLGFYYSFNGNLNSLWQYIIQNRSEIPEALKEFENKSKVNIRNEILNNLGNQFFIGYHGIDYESQSDRINSLKLSFGCKVKNPQNIVLKMKYLFENIFKQKIDKRYNDGYEIYVINPTIQNPLNNQTVENTLAPSFSLVDNYLLISVNHLILINMIDSYERKIKNITDLGLVENNINSKIHINFNSFADDYLKYLIKFSNKTSNFAYSQVEQKIKPFFEAIKNIKKIEYRSIGDEYIFKGNLIIE